MSITLAIIGFCLVYLYDINSITKEYRFARSFFFLGCICIVFASVNLVWQNATSIRTGVPTALVLGAILLAFVLLIYTLFFALPFEDTYQSDTNKICDTGMYALCRHPGVLWFCAFYACLVWLFDSPEMFTFFVLVNALNVLYIILQDTIIFPKLFSGYDLYQQSTPFLIPTTRSIKQCLRTMRGRNHDVSHKT